VVQSQPTVERLSLMFKSGRRSTRIEEEFATFEPEYQRAVGLEKRLFLRMHSLWSGQLTLRCDFDGCEVRTLRRYNKSYICDLKFAAPRSSFFVELSGKQPSVEIRPEQGSEAWANWSGGMEQERDQLFSEITSREASDRPVDSSYAIDAAMSQTCSCAKSSTLLGFLSGLNFISEKSAEQNVDCTAQACSLLPRRENKEVSLLCCPGSQPRPDATGPSDPTALDLTSEFGDQVVSDLRMPNGATSPRSVSGYIGWMISDDSSSPMRSSGDRRMLSPPTSPLLSPTATVALPSALLKPGSLLSTAETIRPWKVDLGMAKPREVGLWTGDVCLQPDDFRFLDVAARLKRRSRSVGVAGSPDGVAASLGIAGIASGAPGSGSSDLRPRLPLDSENMGPDNYIMLSESPLFNPSLESDEDSVSVVAAAPAAALPGGPPLARDVSRDVSRDIGKTVTSRTSRRRSTSPWEDLYELDTDEVRWRKRAPTLDKISQAM